MEKFSVTLTLDERDILVEGLKVLRALRGIEWNAQAREAWATIDLLALRLELMEMEGVA